MSCNLCHHSHFRKLPFHYIWEGKRFQGQQCASCGLICLSPLPNEEELSRLYAADYFESGLHGLDNLGIDFETWSDRRQSETRRFIRQAILARHPSAKSLFEVGAAMGHFLAAAHEEGLTCGGLEISPVAVTKARERFGLDLLCGNIEDVDLSLESRRWDVVYAGDLLEHLRDPNGVLAKISQILTPDGLCVLRLPGTFNLLSTRLAVPLLRLLGRQKRLPDKPYHLYEYTTATIRRLVGKHFPRVDVLNEATPPGNINLKTRSVEYHLKYALQFLNYPLTRVTNRFGDRMTVFAWKSH